MEITHDQTSGEQNKPREKSITIIINGTPIDVVKDDISFSELVQLAGLPSGPNVSYTITYRKGHGNKPEGTLVDTESVNLKGGMIFNVTATDRS